jgi:hypothetical protein
MWGKFELRHHSCPLSCYELGCKCGPSSSGTETRPCASNLFFASSLPCHLVPLFPPFRLCRSRNLVTLSPRHLRSRHLVPSSPVLPLPIPFSLLPALHSLSFNPLPPTPYSLFFPAVPPYKHQPLSLQTLPANFAPPYSRCIAVHCLQPTESGRVTSQSQKQYNRCTGHDETIYGSCKLNQINDLDCAGTSAPAQEIRFSRSVLSLDPPVYAAKRKTRRKKLF